MTIDLDTNISYELGEDNILVTDFFDKDQIVLCDTHRKGMTHYHYWVNRLNGRYKFTTPFTVDKDGTIYHHYNSYFVSVNLGNKFVDSKAIFISLVNEGWLEKDETTGEMKNWVGDVYEGDDHLNSLWRKKQYWAPYTKEQLGSVIELCSYLSIEHGIPLEVMDNNVAHSSMETFNGVAYKSNYNTFYTDINPSWFFDKFKNELEQRKVKNEI